MLNAAWLRMGMGIVTVTFIFVASASQQLMSVVRPLGYTATLRSQSLHLSRGDANAVQLEIYAVGQRFTLQAGADTLLQAQVTYASEAEPPRVMYVERANRGYASLYQPLAKPDAWGRSPNLWQVTLREEIPYYLICNLTAGIADLDLNRLTLAKVHLTSQSEQLNVDMTHKRPGGMMFFLQYTGTGVAHIRLPKDMPVQIQVMNALTQIDGQPIAEGRSWSNLAYSRMLSTKSLVTVIVSNESGVVVIDA